MGETLPQVKIARIYIKNGGKAIFFSHGGKFEHFAKEIGCKVVKLSDLAWKKIIEEMKRKGKFEKISFEKLLFKAYKKEIIGPLVEEEIEAFKNTKVKLVVSSFNPTSSISTRVLNIPLVVINSGTAIPPYFEQGSVTFPENYENTFTRILPSSIKNRTARWILLHNKLLVKDFNKVAKKYNIKRFRTLNDILNSNHTFVCDDINFLGIQPTDEFPSENFIGPISGGLLEKQKDILNEDIKIHLERSGKSILLMMGNTCDKQLYLKILDILNQTDYNVIAVYTTIEKEQLPVIKENILPKQYIESPQLVNRMVDLAIIHGGRGTVYTVAHSGKPAIGMPMYFEHQYNIDNIVRNGAGLRISKKFFKQQDLLKAINTIFTDYDKFLKNAQDLAAKLTKVPGEEKATQRLIEIIEENTAR